MRTRVTSPFTSVTRSRNTFLREGEIFLLENSLFNPYIPYISCPTDSRSHKLLTSSIDQIIIFIIIFYY